MRLQHQWWSGLVGATALKEAAQVGFPRDKIEGPHQTCAESEMVPAGEAARGFICAIWWGTGTRFPLIQDIPPTSMPGARGRGRNGRSARNGGTLACCAP